MAEQNPLTNDDLAPVPMERRTWDTYHIAALWMSMSACIPSYMLASGLIKGGMNWWQAILTVFLGNLIVSVPMVLNAHAGTKYGIPFPVLARASFGVQGANVAAMARAIVAAGWFGIQTWIGGGALHAVLSAMVPAWNTLPQVGGYGLGQWIAFFVFWLANVYFIVKGTESIRKLQSLAAPFLILCGLGLVAWGVQAANGFGPLLSQPSKFTDFPTFWAFFVPSLTGMVGFWATMSLNIADFSRYAKSQRSQVVGQLVGLPPTMALFAFIGTVATSASVVVYGKAIWDPVELISKFENPFVLAIAMAALAMTTLATNIAANVVSPANDISNLNPQKISFRTGGLITAVAGIVIMPWRLLSDFGAYIFGWLIGYSAFLGPIGGILMVDYYLIRRCQLDADGLYSLDGPYRFQKGFNLKALVAFSLGVVAGLIGLVVPSLRFLYDQAWFVGLGVAGVVYWLLMAGEARQAATEGTPAA